MKTILTFFFFSCLFMSNLAQINLTIPPKKIYYFVKDDEKKTIVSASIIMNPIGNYTTTSYYGKHLGKGKYLVEIPANDQSSQFNVTITCNDYEDLSTSYQTSQGDKIDIIMFFDNYYKKYNVNHTHLIEIFGTKECKLQNSNLTSETNLKVFIPYPLEHFTIHKSNDQSAFYQYTSREKLYHDLLKEIILQTSASKSQFVSKEIKEWIQENYSNFGGKNLNKFYDVVNNSAKVFSKLFLSKLEAWSTAVEGLNLGYSLVKANNEGLLEGLLLFFAYQTYQWESYQLIVNRSQNSPLNKDEAYSNALSRLKQTLISEQQKHIDEIVNEMSSKKEFAATCDFVIHKFLSEAVGKLWKAPSLSTFLITNFVTDVIEGAASTVKMDLSMILLAQIDNYILNVYDDSFDSKKFETYRANMNYTYGSLMRIHTGFLYHTIREKFYTGKESGFTGAALNILIQLFSSRAPYLRKMVEISKQKIEKAENDYFLLSDCVNLTKKKIESISQVILGFILDSSGSMKENDPHDIRKSAMRVIIDQVSNNEKIFLIDFDDRAMWLNPNNYENCDKNLLKNAIDGINSDGETEIANGFLTLQSAIESTGSSKLKAGVVLLTDGKNNNAFNFSVIDWFKQKNIPIYTVSFVGEADHKLLSDIASMTNGKYFRANSSQDVVTAFNQFIINISGNSYLAVYKNLINQGEYQNYTFNVDNGMSFISSMNTWGGSKIKLKLISPQNLIYKENDKNGEWYIGSNYSSVKISNPEQGKWKAEFYGESIPSRGENFIFQVSGDSPNKFELEEQQASSGQVKFTLVEASGLQIKNIKPQIDVTTPKNRKIDISNSFNDNSFSFRPKDGQGNYNFDINISGKDGNGLAIQRYFARSFFVGDALPSNIAPIEFIEGNYLTVGLGKDIGNFQGLECLIYSKENNEQLAKGYVTMVTATECNIEITEFLSSSDIQIGDMVVLNLEEWKQD